MSVDPELYYYTWYRLTLGAIHKVYTLRFRNFGLLSPCTSTYAFRLQPTIQYERIDSIFQRSYDRDVFCELISIKELHTMLQSKETAVQNYWKMSNQNTKKSPGIQFKLFNCTGEMIIDNFRIWIAHFILFLF